MLSLNLLSAASWFVVGCSSPAVEGEPQDKPPTSSDPNYDAGADATVGPVPLPGDTTDDIVIPSDPTPEQPCGNAELDDEESCDDGNRTAGDGCDAECQIEDNYGCPIVGALCIRATVCGDAMQTGAERCDDGNTEDGDGCSSTCLLESDYACPEPGQPCVSTVSCGDGVISGGETCDDGNEKADDGCDAACQIEDGWRCEGAGLRCQPVCGDGVIVGREGCDDGNLDDGDGCSSACRLEPGYVCDAANEACRETVCGDGVAEGDEPCDDGDDIHVGDGCSPGCVLEPVCAAPTGPTQAGDSDADAGEALTELRAGVCRSSCGDGLLLAGDSEECDDGNSVAGDGCDDTCLIEDGWTCELASGELPEELVLPVVYRDFIHKPVPESGYSRHPDFERFSGSNATLGLVAPLLGIDGKPVYTGICEQGQALDAEECPYSAQTTSQANFDQWYRDTEEVNVPVLDSLTFTRNPDDTYVFDGQGGLFPLDEAGWVASTPPREILSSTHNFGFTSELRYWFEYRGGEFLEFEGDDDVWVFVGGHLLVDIGGLHPSRKASITLDEDVAATYGLEKGRVYEIALFHAERHTNQSNFKLTIGGFVSSKTTCSTVCGDGVVAGDELCDDGEDNGSGYGFCSDTCTPGERCGDGEVNGDEACDDGINLSGYQSDGEENCAPGCVLPSRCGDGVLDARFGEQCDDGAEDNDGRYGGCNDDCTLGPRCGDGQVNGEERCDDGNQSNRDECSVECTPIRRPTTK